MTTKPATRTALEIARDVVRAEAQAVAALESKLGLSFTQAVDTIAGCRGKLVVAGVGKSGLIGQKIAATLTSTGTPAIFLHPAEALHGDAGLFTRGDVALFISKSGATPELMALLPYLDRMAIPLVSLIVQPGSPLVQKSVAAVACGVDGLFFETHPEPERALSDAATQLPLAQAAAFLDEAIRVHEAVQEAPSGRRA